MRKKVNGINIMVLQLVILLPIVGLSFLLFEEGEHFMVKKANAGGVPARPPIDMNVPSRIETATFAMG